MKLPTISGSNFFSITSATSSTGQGSAAAPGRTVSDSGSASRPGAFLSQLQSMSPADAKQALSDLADKFRSQAGGRGSALADAFQKAANTGDLTDLMQAAKGGGSAGWARGAGAYSSTMAVTRASM